MPPKEPSEKVDFTHFLCIPLVTSTSRPQLQKSLQAFRSDIRDCHTPESPCGIPENAIRPLGTLHLTLGVMNLLTDERIDGALALLHSLDIPSLISVTSVGLESAGKLKEKSTSKDADIKPLKVTLRGLESMDPPSNTPILYSPPDNVDRRLYHFCSKLKDAFSDFLVPQWPLILHATIVNIKGGEKKIDAWKVLERYCEFVWMADMRIEKVAICLRGARSIRDADGVETGDEEYVVEGEVDLP